MPDEPSISPEALVAALQALLTRPSGGPSSAPPAPLTDEAIAAAAAEESSRRLAALAQQFGAPRDLPLAQVLVLRSGANVDSSPRNPVPRPPAEFGKWFDVLDTADGQHLAQSLGPRSGYFAEYANWAPVVSYQYDLLLRLIAFASSPDIPATIRAGLEPLVSLFAEVIDLAVSTLAVRRTQAAHANSPLAEAYKALHTNIQLAGAASRYTPALERETTNQIRAQIQKSTIKAQADGATRGRRSGRSTDKPGSTSEGALGSGHRGRPRGRGQGQGRGRRGASPAGNPFADA